MAPSDGNDPFEPTPEELHKAEEATSIAAVGVHAAVRKEGEDELKRPSSALAWSGLAAGLSMGFSLLGEGLLQAHLPDLPWRPLITKLGYTLGFLIVILGRQQLFTENTLTVVLPLLHHKDRTTLFNVARLWIVVLLANSLGVWFFALSLRPPVFDPQVLESFRQIGMEALAPGAGVVFLKGIFGGWLIALMVWLLPGSESSRLATIVIITYLVGLGKMSHIIAGSAEVLYLAVNGAAGYAECLVGYMLPALAGNILGGVALVAALNHAQVVAGRKGR
ncbi:formate/nitrite transporter family protein [Geomesophilobacter sediminis]|uniref:Formate/nitrite transporter family protein n=1 Tax=Geomesophilobacter sediminis TaxID=2798584 RepID=A0A8J7IYV5_9BACT|nr:formate/nitrite transporter family protein [Geomesophilobacter sediminis]MBJ6723103.1 formate/nitrite transporter family protein [Geomesophilobacter sediminis]